MQLLTAVRAAGHEPCGQERGVSSAVAAGACASKAVFSLCARFITGKHGLTFLCAQDFFRRAGLVGRKE